MSWLLIWGTVLEIAGAALVLVGVLRDRRAYTNRPGLVGATRAQLKRLLRRLGWVKGQAVTLEGVGVLGEMTMTAKGEVTKAWPDDIDGQILWLRERIQAERERADQEISEVRQSLNAIYARVSSRLHLLEEADRGMASTFEEYVTSGLRPQAIGAWLVIAGILLSTWGGRGGVG